MTWELRLSHAAERDIEDVLLWTYSEFGESQYERYKAIIAERLEELANNPDHPLAKTRPEIHTDARTMHLARVGVNARHFFLFRVIGDDVVEVGRLLHDSMDLPEHLPPGFSS